MYTIRARDYHYRHPVITSESPVSVKASGVIVKTLMKVSVYRRGNLEK